MAAKETISFPIWVRHAFDAETIHGSASDHKSSECFSGQTLTDCRWVFQNERSGENVDSVGKIIAKK